MHLALYKWTAWTPTSDPEWNATSLLSSFITKAPAIDDGYLYFPSKFIANVNFPYFCHDNEHLPTSRHITIMIHHHHDTPIPWHITIMTHHHHGTIVTSRVRATVGRKRQVDVGGGLTSGEGWGIRQHGTEALQGQIPPETRLVRPRPQREGELERSGGCYGNDGVDNGSDASDNEVTTGDTVGRYV